jgi:integrase
MVKEVKLEHIQEFINEKAESCSMETLSQYVSRFNKLEKLVNQKFGIKVKYKGVVIPAAKENTKIRDKSMKVEHYQKLKSELSESKTIGKIGLELSAKLGLRASEIAKLQGRDINLEKGEVHVHNGKGARNRNVPIREEDRAYFTNLKARLGERERPCPGKADSVNAAIRRYMKRVDIAKEYRVTTVHAIRKMYAQSEFDRYRAQGHDIKAAIGKVSEQLGHGENRIALMREYVLNIK